MDAERIRDRLSNACDGAEVDAAWRDAQVAQSNRAVFMNGEENVRIMLWHGANAIRRLGEEIPKIGTSEVLYQSFLSIINYLGANIWDIAPLAVAYDLLALKQSSTAPLPAELHRSLERLSLIHI